MLVKPAPTGYRRGGFHQLSMPETNNIINPPPPNEQLFYGDKIMKYDPHKHHRRSIRLPGYDYRVPGAYFITICSWQRECLFGEVINDKMQLSRYGKTVLFNWSILPKRKDSGLKNRNELRHSQVTRMSRNSLTKKSHY